MASPMLHKLLCGGFREGAARQLTLEDVDGRAFEDVLAMWCGTELRNEMELSDVMSMASVADRLQMAEVATTLEDAIVQAMTVGTCAQLLMGSKLLGLMQVEAAAWGMAVGRFEEVSGTAGFMELDDDTVGRLLEEDGLGVRAEETAFEGLLGWMQGGEGRGLRGRELLCKIRFGVMEQGYLESKAREGLRLVPEEHRGWVGGLVEDALGAPRSKAPVEPGRLGPKALTRRWGMGVEWGRYGGGGTGRRLAGHPDNVFALAECSGRMCSGSWDGLIRVWSMATLELERVLNTAGDNVSCLAARGGEVISGHASGRIRVWDATSGEQRRELEGHVKSIQALCVCGPRLASGSNDRLIKVWRIGAVPEWQCERKLRGHSAEVTALAAWEDKLISGSADATIRVWDLSTGGLVALLVGQGGVRRVFSDDAGSVSALLVAGGRMYSASRDGTIRVWDVGTWAAVRTVEAYGEESQQNPESLCVCGAKLVSGSASAAGLGGQYEVRVWDPETMACEHTLREAAGAEVLCLTAVGGEVWGGVGSTVVVWGRD